MDEREIPFALQLERGSEEILVGEDHVTAVLPRGLDLGRDGPGGHHDGAGDANGRGRPGDGLRMVPRGKRDDSPSAFRGGERIERGEDASWLERPRLLEELQLERHPRADAPVEVAGARDRCAMDTAGEAGRGTTDVIEADERRSRGRRLRVGHGTA